MGLDSVELVLGFEEFFGITISDDEAYRLETPRMVMDLVFEKVGAVRNDESPSCLCQPTFQQVRDRLLESTAAKRQAIRPSTKLLTLFPRKNRRHDWHSFRLAIGAPALPNLNFGRGHFFHPITVRDVVTHLLHHHFTQRERSTWTRNAIREGVRFVIWRELGIRHFADDDHFIRDLGID